MLERTGMRPGPGAKLGKDSIMEAESERPMRSYGDGGVALDEEYGDGDDEDGEEDEDGGGGEDFLLRDRSTGSSCACVGASGP